MVGKLSLLLTMLFACAVTAMAQVFTYSYIDPCTGKKQYVSVNEPNGSITMSYNKFIKTFKIEDFNSGAFDSWLTEIKNAIPGNNPCGGVGVEVTTTTNTLIAMNTVGVTTTVVAAVAGAVMSGTSDIVGGAADVTSAGGISDAKGDVDVDAEGGESGGGSSDSKDGKSTSSKKKDGKGGEKKEGETPSGGGSGEGGGSGGGEGGGGGKTEETPQGSGKSDGGKSEGGDGSQGGGEEGGGGELSGGANSANASGGGGNSKQKNAEMKKGNIIATGDIVAIQNQSTDNTQQFRINASMIYADSKKILTYGGLLNFTTAINNSSVTGFVSYRMKKVTGVLANSTMINFDRDLFNTTAVIVMYPVWKFGTMVGGNATYGMFGTSSFTSYSALAGANGTIPLGKVNLNLMLVGLYSPYTFYYEGMWYKTNIILVPFASLDYSVTKTFKFNISFSSVYEVKNNVLNYQVLLGGKYLF